jgi:release factor glutamine methyltransferase
MSAADAGREVEPYSSEATAGGALAAMRRAFADAGLESPQRDARFLLQGLLRIDGSQLLTRPERQLGAAAEKVRDAVRRRIAHEPVARILGRREFYGREYIVTPDVLDPRPETEAVVDLALAIVRSSGLADSALSIADIGTGSGILISTLLAELPNATGTATDLSTAALEVARQNSVRIGVADRARFIATRGLDGCCGPFNLIVSNPPYIPTDEVSRLERGVRDYDPIVALDGGADGLQVYREIAREVGNLRDASRQSLPVVLEVGAGQAEAVRSIFQYCGWRPVTVSRDLDVNVRAVALEIQC